MLKQQLLKFSKYNRWANEKCAAYLLAAGPSLIDKEQASSFPTIRKTYFHIWDAELIWIKRLHGKTIDSWPPSAQFTGTLEEGVKQMLLVSDEFTEFINASSDEILQEPLSYMTNARSHHTSITCDMISHCMNHSTYHRGQIITMLRGAGFKEVGSTDYIAYCRLV
jgi:uncharacterized damage-inducible protein DinB